MNKNIFSVLKKEQQPDEQSTNTHRLNKKERRQIDNGLRNGFGTHVEKDKYAHHEQHLTHGQ